MRLISAVAASPAWSRRNPIRSANARTFRRPEISRRCSTDPLWRRVVVACRYDTELGQQLLQLPGQPFAVGRVVDREAVLRDARAAVAFEHRHQECALHAPASAPHHLGNALVGRAKADHLGEWARPERRQVLDVELVDLACGRAGSCRERDVARTADDLVVCVERPRRSSARSVLLNPARGLRGPALATPTRRRATPSIDSRAVGTTFIQALRATQTTVPGWISSSCMPLEHRDAGDRDEAQHRVVVAAPDAEPELVW